MLPRERETLIESGETTGRRSARQVAHALFFAGLVFAGFVLIVAGPAAAATISIVPDFDRIEPNQTLTLDILIDDIDATTAVGGIDLRIAFDPARVAFASAQLGTGLAVGGFPTLDSTNVSANEVQLVQLALAPSDVLIASQPSGFSLARIEFRTLSLGPASFTITPSTLISDPFGAALELEGLGFAAVQVVPEPGAAALFLAGLIVAGRSTAGARARRTASR